MKIVLFEYATGAGANNPPALARGSSAPARSPLASARGSSASARGSSALARGLSASARGPSVSAHGSSAPAHDLSALAREGELMLHALGRGLSLMDDVRLVTVRDARLPPPDYATALVPVRAGDDCFAVVGAALEDADAFWPVAPETGGLLARLCRLVRGGSCLLLNAPAAVVEEAGGKYSAFLRLRQNGVRCVETARLGGLRFPQDRDLVIKPDDGVGCESVHLLRAGESPPRGAFGGDDLCQPYLPGIAASLNVIYPSAGAPRIVGANRQEVVLDAPGTPNALDAADAADTPNAPGTSGTPDTPNAPDAPDAPGAPDTPNAPNAPGASGTPDAPNTPNTPDALDAPKGGRFRLRACHVNALAREALDFEALADGVQRSFPGIVGHVGIDLIVDGDNTLHLLEINPRVTTSFAGLAASTGLNPCAEVIRAVRGEACEPVFRRRFVPVEIRLDGAA